MMSTPACQYCGLTDLRPRPELDEAGAEVWVCVASWYGVPCRRQAVEDFVHRRNNAVVSK
jgi:hypothetical protein